MQNSFPGNYSTLIDSDSALSGLVATPVVEVTLLVGFADALCNLIMNTHSGDHEDRLARA